MKASSIPIDDLRRKYQADPGSLTVDEVEAIARYKKIVGMSEKPKAAKKPAGKSKRISEVDEVARMAAVGAPDRMIGDALGISVRTIQRKFAAIVRKARALRRIKILECQMAAVEKGVPALLIWIGKNELGQLDAPEAPKETTTKPDTTLKIVRMKPPEAAPSNPATA